jgi:hypothetical protein
VGALKGGHIGPSSIARGRRGSKHLHARQPEDPTARRRACQDGRDRYAARRDVRVGAHQRSGLSGTSLSPAPCGHVRQRSGGRLTARTRSYVPPETVGGRLGDKSFMGGPLMVDRPRAARISVPLARTAAGRVVVPAWCEGSLRAVTPRGSMRPRHAQRRGPARSALPGGPWSHWGRQPMGKQEMGTTAWTSRVMEPIRHVVRDMIG